MRDLNFPKFEFRFKINENKRFIFDEIRKKYVLLTPEEWVRQHVVRFLIDVKNYPKSYINVEKVVKINNMNKRYDVVVFAPNGSIFLLVECKEPNVKINQTVFDQIARYNLSLNAAFLMVTNGLNHYYCKLDYKNSKYQFLADLP
ncbi:type I restriction enzyme HsdR N-terminal domain-containing protein [Paenimyroides aestuarii]|uniref:Type I restriction enzyme HsdR N-terminal domain-containing protein n=1 Tax=Paenimyroides aestuarii TaxID=2968490 RepID=A0ABY5NRP4_9FLAO|nr:type I restriction enzyme HsdR N-terminal domain-containing protein [Paenimyroides aestuarii]UUV21152.1 type I restriction enzyme HsdR N-terminal domain-containing protein [Paenimyroides aestuarii]